jgi:RecA/RadA recombinase
MSDALWNSLVKETKNNMAQAVCDGVMSGDITEYIDSGSYALNALISGDIYKGYPVGKVTALAGEEASGKSFAVLTGTKNFLEAHPDSACFYFESEGAITKEDIESRGIDSKRIFIIPVATVEDFRTQAVRILDKYIEAKKESRPRMLFVLDSLGMLSTNKEVKDTTEGKDVKDMTRTQLIKGAFRILTLKLAQAKVPMILTNHVYAVFDMYSPSEIGGGSGVKYAASTIVILNKRKEKEDGQLVGLNIRANLYKSRLTKTGAEVSVLIRHDTGLQRYYGLVDIAEKCGVFKKDSTRLVLPDGRKVFGTQINRDPEKYFTKEILDLINEKMKPLFCYGAGEADTDEAQPEETTNE